MRNDALRGWPEAVRRAREKWPQIPGWAYDLAGAEAADEDLETRADGYPLDAEAVGELAVRAACQHGWDPERDEP